MPYLTSNSPTWVKRSPGQSDALPAKDKFRVPKGQKFGVLDAYEDVKGHMRILMADKLTVGGSIWKDAYIWGGHWDGITALKKKAVGADTAFSRAGSPMVLQPTPYYIQNDNKDWCDDGSASNLRHGAVQCGATSIAMVLGGVLPNSQVEECARDAGGAFDNWVAGQLKRFGLTSTNAADIVTLLGHLGIKARYTRDATVGELKENLEHHPCMLGLAYKSSGHFVCARGFNRATGAVIVNDPFGRRQLSGSFNQWEAICYQSSDTFGLNNEYSPSVLDNLWVDGGEASGHAVFLDRATPNYGNGSTPIVIPPKSSEGSPTEVVVGGSFDAGQLKRAIAATCNPQLPPEEITQLVAALALECPKYGIDSSLRLIHFLAQVGHESGGYWWLEEIASGADYEGREDLGNTQAGDGKRYKGRGLIQLTGRSNYQAFAKFAGSDVVGSPDLVKCYPLALTSAIYFWDREELSAIADEGVSELTTTRITKRVNGGTNGLPDRLERVATLSKILMPPG